VKATTKYYFSQFKFIKMVKFQKVLLVIGFCAALLSVIIDLYDTKFNDWGMIAMIMFFTSYIQVDTISDLEKRLEEKNK
jgi:hypothetical protein